MKNMTKEELLNINGGSTITATMLNALARVGTFVLDLGRSLGTTIKRYITNTLC